MDDVTNGTVLVLTPVFAVPEPGHSLSHVYKHVQSICGRHEWIPAHTLDIHSCSHYMASNNKTTVDSGAAIHVCPSWCGLSAKQLSLTSAGGDVLRHLGSKLKVNHEVALVVRPILSVDMLISKGVQVVVRSWIKQFVHSTD